MAARIDDLLVLGQNISKTDLARPSRPVLIARRRTRNSP
jgi:hypothetical protein